MVASCQLSHTAGFCGGALEVYESFSAKNKQREMPTVEAVGFVHVSEPFLLPISGFVVPLKGCVWQNTSAFRINMLQLRKVIPP